MSDLWDRLTDAGGRMLSDLCDGHPGYALELYRLDLPNGIREWLCRTCWGRRWDGLGRPVQPLLAAKDGS